MLLELELELELTRQVSALLVPRESLVLDGAATYIFVADDGSARRVPVITKSRRGRFVQIEGDVNEGDLLIVQGQTYLEDGSAIEVVEQTVYFQELIVR